MPAKGYIKLWRKVWDDKLFRQKRVFSRFEAWIDMLMLANGKNNKMLFDGNYISIKRGQFITSERTLAERWNWSRTKVRNFLDLLSKKNDQKIEPVKNHKKTVITIIKYSKYNPLKNEKKPQGSPQKNHRKTTEKPLKNRTNEGIKKVNEINKEYIVQIINHWNSKNIKNLENRESKIRKKTVSKINVSLKDYSFEEIKEAIDNYSEILNSDDYFFSYKWQFCEFLDRGLVNFLIKNRPHENYLKDKFKNKNDPEWLKKVKEWRKQND